MKMAADPLGRLCLALHTGAPAPGPQAHAEKNPGVLV